MVESFGIDSITSYFKNLIPDTSPVINPQYRELDREHKKTTTLLKNRKLKYADITLQNKEMSEKEIERFTQKKSDMQLEIEDLDIKRSAIIAEKKTIEKKILFDDLDENQKFKTSVNERKFFLDTIKIIAYRAETALCNIIKKQMNSPQEARTLIRKLYYSDADLELDEANSALIVKLHRTNHWADDRILEYLCEQLNETKTDFPATKLTCQFKLVTF
jgi:ABC-type iron transport system FetAB ATPase subunit